MTLRFYIDDSGRNDPPVFVLGGMGIATDRVVAFEQAWNAVLAEAPAIPYFKMAEANARRGAFQGVPPAERDTKVAALGEVLRTHATATLAVVVRHEDYARVYAGKMMRWMDRPYQMMFHFAIATAFKLCREQDLGESAEFVFDRDLDNEKSLAESYPAFRKGMEPALAAFLPENPRHADDRDEVALQAADLVAWHVRRSWRDGPGALAGASSAGPAIASLPGKHDVFSEATLTNLARIATGTVRRMKTVFPYEADRIGEQFDRMATVANLHLIAGARPLQPVALISFPAIGTGKYLLVRNCAQLDRPHLHKRFENRCLGEATTA
ncbi:DUF3800 domain-containing protein [Sphingomonas sp. LB-2]|uniref:DUF3800 domain-containing protein n=1 Tax=Sphingomonas caeni TaxID=2984949 RepID=UPI00222E6644|nr:DUF3800 domain-containing protein [Sphingomonas caeni]MCW3848103.1 DUF3800 domain-containing protein [Sphingomonas caeni]